MAYTGASWIVDLSQGLLEYSLEENTKVIIKIEVRYPSSEA